MTHPSWANGKQKQNPVNYLVCRPNLIFCRHNLLHSSLIRINHPQLSQIPTDRPGNLVQKKRNSALLTAPCGIIVPTVTLVAAGTKRTKQTNTNEAWVAVRKMQKRMIKIKMSKTHPKWQHLILAFAQVFSKAKNAYYAIT